MSYPLATAEGAGYLTESGTPAFKVQVWHGSTLLVDDLPFLTGAVTEDETAKVRRKLSLKVDPLATNPVTGGSLVPSKPGDLLHPLSNNDLRVFRGFVLANGTTDMVPLGVFRLVNPTTADNGKQITLDLAGNDWSFLIAQRRWQGPYIPVPGASIDNAIKALLLNRWGTTLPALTFNFTPTTVTVPYGTVFGLSIDSSGSVHADAQNNDPWADAQTMAASAGMELFMDRTGVPTLRPIPQASTQAVAVKLVEGANCTLASVNRSLDASKVQNGIKVIGTGARVNVLVQDTSATTVTVNASSFGAGQGGNGSWAVPMNVTSVQVTIAGSAGDASHPGDEITATLSCTPGDVFTYTVNTRPASGQVGYPGFLHAEGETFLAAGGGAGSSIVPTGGTLNANANTGDGYVSFTYTGYSAQSVQGPPVSATQWDDNPQSPTYYLGQFGEVPADPVVDPNIATQADAQTAAKARLTLLLASADDTDGEIWPPNPTLDAGDSDLLVRARAAVNATYVMSAITTPLDRNSRQKFTNRSASITV